MRVRSGAVQIHIKLQQEIDLGREEVHNRHLEPLITKRVGLLAEGNMHQTIQLPIDLERLEAEDSTHHLEPLISERVRLLAERLTDQRVQLWIVQGRLEASEPILQVIFRREVQKFYLSLQRRRSILTCPAMYEYILSFRPTQ